MSATETTPEATRERRVRFLKPTDDPPPPLPTQPAREPRDGEALADYVVALAKEAGIVDHGAALTAATKERIASDLIRRAADDEHFGGSRAGRALLAGVELWNVRNPEIGSGLGELGAISADLANRPTRGVPKLLALLLSRIAADPAAVERLSDVERALLAFTPEIELALAELEDDRERHLARVAGLAATAQTAYPAGEPGPAVDRREGEEEA